MKQMADETKNKQTGNQLDFFLLFIFHFWIYLDNNTKVFLISYSME